MYMFASVRLSTIANTVVEHAKTTVMGSVDTHRDYYCASSNSVVVRGLNWEIDRTVNAKATIPLKLLGYASRLLPVR